MSCKKTKQSSPFEISKFRQAERPGGKFGSVDSGLDFLCLIALLEFPLRISIDLGALKPTLICWPLISSIETRAIIGEHTAYHAEVFKA